MRDKPILFPVEREFRQIILRKAWSEGFSLTVKNLNYQPGDIRDFATLFFVILRRKLSE